jgi:LAS superfamily LD-carboxypeptidase LdcB
MSIEINIGKKKLKAIEDASRLKGVTVEEYLISSSFRSAKRNITRSVNESEIKNDLWIPPVIDPNGPQPTGHPARNALVLCGEHVRSSVWVDTGGVGNRVPIANRGQSGYFVSAAAKSLNELTVKATEAGMDIQLNSGFRSWQSQEYLYQRYINWLNAGKPAWDSAQFDSKTMQVEAAGRPGYGTHQSGRAIDIRLSKLKESGHLLGDFWDLAAEYGWRPFYTIKNPDWDVSEAWHFDFYGEWDRVFLKTSYVDMMKACTADVALLAPSYVKNIVEIAKQAQLARAGEEFGSLDGIIGPKTIAAAKNHNIDLNAPDNELWPLLFNLPTAKD